MAEFWNQELTIGEWLLISLLALLIVMCLRWLRRPRLPRTAKLKMVGIDANKWSTPGWSGRRPPSPAALPKDQPKQTAGRLRGGEVDRYNTGYHSRRIAGV